MLTKQQIEDRRKGIGGSDIAAILGLSPWSTPLDMYLDKIGEAPPKDLSGKAPVEWGNRLEDVVADKFSDDTGLKVRRSNQHLAHRELPFALANIDRSVVGKPFGLKAGLECKTASSWTKADMWGPGAIFSMADGALQIVSPDDQVPLWYLAQCAWYMAVTDSDLWFLSVLIGGSDFRTYTIFRDQQFESVMLRKAGDFWLNNVLARTPPPPSCPADIESLYPVDNGEPIEATASLAAACAEAKELQAELKRMDARLDELKGTIKTACGEGSSLVYEGKTLATWKAPRPGKRFDSKSFQLDHPELFQQYQHEMRGARRLLIK